MTLLFGFAKETAGRAVVTLPEDSGVLEKLVGLDHLLEFFALDEVILLAVLLAAPRIACGVGDGEIEVGHELQNLVHQG